MQKDQVNQGDNGEGEDAGDGDDKDDKLVTDYKSDHSHASALRDQYRSGAAASGQGLINRAMTKYLEVNEELYKPNALNEEVDQLTGVAAEHYANISKSNS